eukprot:gene17170-5314_t
MAFVSSTKGYDWRHWAVGGVAAVGSIFTIIKIRRASRLSVLRKSPVIVLEEDDDLAFEVAHMKDFDEIAEFFYVNWMDEPQTVHLKLTVDELKWSVHLFLADVIEEKLSVIARDKKTKKIVGWRGGRDHAGPAVVDRILQMLLCALNNNSRIARWICPNPVLQMAPAYYQMMVETPERYVTNPNGNNLQFKGGRGIQIELMVLLVDKESRGKRLSERMHTASHKLWKNNGYKSAFVQASHSGSAHIFKKMGYTEIDCLEYDTFKFAGQYPLRGLKGMGKQKDVVQRGVTVFEKVL